MEGIVYISRQNQGPKPPGEELILELVYPPVLIGFATQLARTVILQHVEVQLGFGCGSIASEAACVPPEAGT